MFTLAYTIHTHVDYSNRAHSNYHNMQFTHAKYKVVKWASVHDVAQTANKIDTLDSANSLSMFDESCGIFKNI